MEVRPTLPDVDRLEIHKHKPAAGAKHKIDQLFYSTFYCGVNLFIPVCIDERCPWLIVWIDPIKPR